MDHILRSTPHNYRLLVHSGSLGEMIGLVAIMAIIGSTGCQFSKFRNLDMPLPPSHLRHDAIPSEQDDLVNESWHQSVQADWQNSPMGYSGQQNDIQSLPYEQAIQSNQHLVRYQSPDTAAKSVRSLLAVGEKKQDIAPPAIPAALAPPALDQLSISGLNEATVAPSNPAQLVKDVVIKGNRRLPTHHLTRNMGTRAGRYYDPVQLGEDVAKFWQIPDIARVKGPFIEQTPEGVVITIEVFERNVINNIKFIGNRAFTDRKLTKESGLAIGGALDGNQVRSARDRIESLYKTKGYPRTQVEVLDGGSNEDAEIVFLIHEDQKQRIWKAEFEGNQIASDARLQSLVESKPGHLKFIGGLVNRDEIEQDMTRLTQYYRSLGYFNARIGREIQESNDGRWLTIRFIINEGPRYKVRNVSFIGNGVYPSEQLDELVKLKPGENGSPSFNAAKMNADVVALRDLYGGNGYVFANVEAEPRFLEEPGLLDIVYKITEGKQYRVGDINVRFEGNAGVTRREVVLSRLSLHPGDIIDAREIRNSERRLKAAQIFDDGSGGSQGVRLTVVPPELKNLERHADARLSQ